MPRNKDLKRLVRDRMQKTGEAYTTARLQITRKTAAKNGQSYAKLAGMSDEKVLENTGSTWESWTKTLDREGAAAMSHAEIARLVSTKYGVPSWWTQTVTVGYERIKGLRARGQQRDGSYEASKSRTFNVPVTVLYAAWSDTAKRKRWLKEPGVKVRTTTAPKSMRLGFGDGTIVLVGFLAKGESKSSIAVQHTKLPNREGANRMKEFWSERFDALEELLHDT